MTAGITRQTGKEGFSWWFGVVRRVAEDKNKVGMAQVSIIGMHDPEDEDIDGLPWAQVILPTTSASLHGVGDTPQLDPGSTVMGFFLDRETSQPMIIGSLAAIPDMDENLNSLSYLARGKQIINKEKVGVEPESAYAAEYPLNRVIQTRSGHVIELDDTEGQERIHIYHKTGTYIEVNADGRMVVKSVNDSYDVVAKDKLIEIKGNCSLRVEGNCYSIVNGDSVTATKGNCTLSAGKKLTLMGKEGVQVQSGRNISMLSPGGVTLPMGNLTVAGQLSSGGGATDSFTTPNGYSVDVQHGIITGIKK